MRFVLTNGLAHGGSKNASSTGIAVGSISKVGTGFCRPFTPVAARTGNKYVLVATDYCTKWVEAKALRENTATVTTRFLYEHIWCRFGCLIELIGDHGSHFLNAVVRELTHHYAVVHKKIMPYYPQANGLAESTNKTL